MRKYWVVILAVLLVFTQFGCQKDIGTTNIYFPFSVDQIEYIEMIRYTDDIASAEKKVITEIENIRYLYGTFENISLDILHEQPNDEADVVIVFRFYPSDTASDWLWSEETFDLVYYGYGGKNSVLKMPPNEIYFLTSEDVDRIWSELYD